MTANDGSLPTTSAKLVDHGRDSHRLNLVFLSEGFQGSEIPQFHAIVDQVLAEMRVTHPFQTLWPNLNVHRIDVTSVESGADIPTQSIQKRTFFDAKYGNGCRERAISVNERAVSKAVGQFIGGTGAAIVIVNSAKHGGMSGEVITFASGVIGLGFAAMHELGHNLAGLADEYDGATDCPGHSPQAQYAGLEPAEPNITKVRDHFGLKWDDLVGLATPLPTLEVPAGQCLNPPAAANPVADGTVGLFEAAGYFNCGLFRSEFRCRMRNRGFPYCQVCARRLADSMTNWTLRPAELARDIWTPGWDLMSSIQIDGEPHVVSYKPASGSIAIDKVRADGSGTDPVLGSTWSTGWTSIVPLQLSGKPHLLLYKAGTGRMEIDEITNSGQDVTAVSSHTWSLGWTSIIPFTMGGNQFVFSYKKGTGAIAIDQVRDDASDTDSVLGSSWNAGWSHHAIWEQPFGATIVSYRDGDGALDVDRITDSGATISSAISTNVDAGFTSLVPLTWHGEPVFMLHDMSNGVSRFEHIHDPGPGAIPPPNVSVLGPVVGKIGNAFSNSGWQNFSPFLLSGQPHWLAYNGSVAVIDRID